MKHISETLVLLLVVISGCGKGSVDSNAPTDRVPAADNEQKSNVVAHSGAFDARLEADTLAAFWGPGANIRRMFADEAIAFEVNVDTGGRSLTSRFVEQEPVEVDFFGGEAKSDDIERMRSYLKGRYPTAEWKPAIGHFAGIEEQWRIFPLAEKAGN